MRGASALPAQPTLGRLFVAGAGITVAASTLTPHWVTSVRTMGGYGSLNVYSSTSPWDGHFGPWVAAATAALLSAALVAGVAWALHRPTSRPEAAAYLALGALAVTAFAIALWQGPGGDHVEGWGFVVFRSGLAAKASLALAFVPVALGLALIGVPRPATVALAGGVVVLAVVLAVRLVPVHVAEASGPIPDWRTDAAEPYPFITPVPPQVATILDGHYDRPPTDNYPGIRPGCTRCQPYPVDAGRSVLTLDRGRYVLAQQQPHYIDRGHYVVTANHITFYNSPECGSVRGVYRWSLTDGVLELTELFDLCGFGQRARDLTERGWTALP